MTMTMESNMLFGSIGAGTKQDVVTFVPAAACSAVTVLPSAAPTHPTHPTHSTHPTHQSLQTPMMTHSLIMSTKQQVSNFISSQNIYLEIPLLKLSKILNGI